MAQLPCKPQESIKCLRPLQGESHRRRDRAYVMAGKIATSEVEDTLEVGIKKDQGAQARGRKGGAARASAMSPESRAEMARAAARARYAKSE